VNASTLIQRAGLTAGTRVGGEVLALIVNVSTSIPLPALVNRNIVKGRDFMRLFKDFAGDFELMGLTEIAIDKAQLSQPPEAGMYFVDTFGYKHRVRYVTQTHIAWMAYCTPSAVVIVTNSQVTPMQTTIQDTSGNTILDVQGNPFSMS
jgi:hypothetical protein